MTSRRYLGCALVAAAVTTACQGAPAGAPAADPPTEVSVTVTPIVSMTMHAYVDGWGRVEPEPASTGHPAANARVTAPVLGVVTLIASSEGQRIAQGAILFQLDGRVADLAVERARRAVRAASQVVARQEQLGPGQATSQRAYQEAVAQLTMAQGELTTSELQRRLLDVHAPIAGTIVKLNARLGDAVDPSTVLAEIVDLSRLVVSASIRSIDVTHVKPGQRLEFSPGASSSSGAPAFSGATPTGTVDFIGSQVDSATDTVLVRARAPAAAMRPGQFVNVRIEIEARQNRLAVPIASLVQGEAGQEVALVRGNVATRTRVTTGLREGGLVEVDGSGVREGDSVVVSGVYGLPATSIVKVSGR